LSERVPISGRDEVAAFCQAFNRMVDGLSKAQEEILRRHLETIRAMISAVEAKDSYTQGHCVRVQDYTARILEHFPGISISERRRIETSALLHDIGKIGIPDEILLKEGRLSKKEMAVVRTHVLIGEKILQHLDSMRDIAHWNPPSPRALGRPRLPRRASERQDPIPEPRHCGRRLQSTLC
jgi:HD-GYP domain-containing protein (c-di-GMP phosphodiesterase class II)